MGKFTVYKNIQQNFLSVSKFLGEKWQTLFQKKNLQRVGL